MSTATPAPVPESVANEAVEEAGGGQELETGKKRGKSAAGNAARAVSSKWALSLIHISEPTRPY